MMPYRFIPTQITELLAAAMTGVFIASASVLDGIRNSQTIWDKEQFRMYCLLGAIGGAFLSVGIAAMKSTGMHQVRTVALKFVSSGIAGLLFTPIAIRWLELPVDVDVVLGTAGAVAFISVTVLHDITPVFIGKIKTWLGISSDENK